MLEGAGYESGCYVRPAIVEAENKYPLVQEEIQLVRDGVDRRKRIRSELRYLRNRDLQIEELGEIKSRAESMKAVLHKVRQVAPTRSTVLLTGETGTGKSFLAKVIHQNSTRAERQFISVHCGAIPDTLDGQCLFKPVIHPDHHVVDQRARQPVQRFVSTHSGRPCLIYVYGM